MHTHKKREVASEPEIDRSMHTATEPNPDTLAVMLAKYGPLMDFSDVAAEFKRENDRAIRVALARRNPPHWAEELRKARVHHGRRVFFRTRDIALLIERDMPLNDDDDD